MTRARRAVPAVGLALLPPGPAFPEIEFLEVWPASRRGLGLLE